MDESKALLQKYKDEGVEIPTAPQTADASSEDQGKKQDKKALATSSSLTDQPKTSMASTEGPVKGDSTDSSQETKTTPQEGSSEKSASQLAEERLREELSALEKSSPPKGAGDRPHSTRKGRKKPKLFKRCIWIT